MNPPPLTFFPNSPDTYPPLLSRINQTSSHHTHNPVSSKIGRKHSHADISIVNKSPISSRKHLHIPSVEPYTDLPHKNSSPAKSFISNSPSYHKTYLHNTRPDFNSSSKRNLLSDSFDFGSVYILPRPQDNSRLRQAQAPPSLLSSGTALSSLDCHQAQSLSSETFASLQFSATSGDDTSFSRKSYL